MKVSARANNTKSPSQNKKKPQQKPEQKSQQKQKPQPKPQQKQKQKPQPKPQQKQKQKQKQTELDRLVNTPGAILMLFGLPLFLQFLWYSCEKNQCSEIATVQEILRDPVTFLKQLFPLPNTTAVVIFFSWIISQWVFHIVIPGKILRGFPLIHDKSTLDYKMNGLACFIVTIVGFFVITYLGLLDPSVVVKQYGPILVTANITAFVMCLWMYLKGFLYNQGNPSGNLIIDYFYGYEPNPRIYGWITSDVKFFLEGRALSCWVIMDLCFCYVQWIDGGVSKSLALITVLHFFYVLHYWCYESNALSMLDFTAENMGWMLGWGNLVWVEFCFCMPAFYALRNPKPLSYPLTILFFGVWVAGYLIFSQANLQKHRFKNNPKGKIWGKPPKVISTPNGHSILASGWWGLSRKMNYTGDLIQALSFGLPCLSLSLYRDDKWCHSKYGKAWEEYRKIVPYRLIPYVF
eukprot:TRINITY_DN6108_c0_g1_i1.p1 TRINITY_DN6108_c0_g1~~TRINITY_DN6108_c0_g1_i1.p1  ORF type:complete len:462 (-),score=55.89 TRINITY_DN6108_c0_g1_i1:4-1389(-)